MTNWKKHFHSGKRKHLIRGFALLMAFFWMLVVRQLTLCVPHYSIDINNILVCAWLLIIPAFNKYGSFHNSWKKWKFIVIRRERNGKKNSAKNCCLNRLTYFQSRHKLNYELTMKFWVSALLYGIWNLPVIIIIKNNVSSYLKLQYLYEKKEIMKLMTHPARSWWVGNAST